MFIGTVNANEGTVYFSGKLDYIEYDNGGGFYSGVAIGTDFTGNIDFNLEDCQPPECVISIGFLSDGTTDTSFGCCISSRGLSVINDHVLNEDIAANLNEVVGSSKYVAGDIFDDVYISVDKITSAGGRIEIGLYYLLDSSAFSNGEISNYPFDLAFVEESLFFILEENSSGQEIYSGSGKNNIPFSVDECPDDPDKTELGECGCGVPDTDANKDGVLDCKAVDDENSTCSEISGDWKGNWSETSCDSNSYSGEWTGTIQSNCEFSGTDNWDFVSGTIDPSTMVLTASGVSKDGCGTVSVTGTFTADSVSGSYTYSAGGSGTFSGNTVADSTSDNGDDGGGGGCFLMTVCR